MKNAFTRRLCALAATALLLMSGQAMGEAFPSQPIKLIVPASAGGSTDILARTLARIMQEQTGAAVVVENKAGAGGAIGVQALTQAAPTGYTLLVSVLDAITVLPHLRKDIPYKIERDLMPIGIIAEGTWLFAVNPKVRAQNVNDLVQLARAKPGSIKFSSAGTGTSGHLIVEMLGLQNKVQMLHVPYKGAGPATTAVISGEVDFTAASPITLKGFLDSGQVRGLAITGANRALARPNIPTMRESGFPEFVASAWFGVFAPANLPAGRAERLEEIVSAAVHHPDLQDQIAKAGLDAKFLSRSEFAKYVADDSARWKQIIERAKISLSE